MLMQGKGILDMGKTGEEAQKIAISQIAAVLLRLYVHKNPC